MSKSLFIESELLKNSQPVKHGFFGARGGVSEGIYESLNCGYGSNDVSENVATNRALVAQAMGVAADHLINPYQVHSALVQFTDKPFANDAPKVDGLVTNIKGLALGILTADCAPILFADTAVGVIGAAHAGWQGALGGVIEATIDLMITYGANPNNIIAAIGPCIAQKSYEVGIEFRDRFVIADAKNEMFFVAARAHEKFHFDLKSYCAMRLTNSGIGRIDVLPQDTCELETDYFSNRRRNLKGEPDYGRNISVIAL